MTAIRQSGFRYFDSPFAPGHLVLPQSDHFQNLSKEKQAAEAAIRAGDPRGKLRANAIFVFEKREVAERLLEKTPGEHLYEVSFESGDILNLSDLRIYDEIVEALRRKQNAERLVKEFWDGIERADPRIELTVNKVTVCRKLIDNEQK